MEDLIRRSDAIAILEDLQSKHLQFCLVPFRIAIEKVQAIPSADIDLSEYSDKLWKNAYERGKADRPQGEWICHEGGWKDFDYYPTKYECDQCHHYVDVASDKKFCPNCGARMKGADDETD